MRWVVFCWSSSSVPPEGLREDDVIVCADSGMEYARRCGLVPSIVLGDFDSYRGSLPSHTEILRLPVEKDDTDTLLAIKLGIEKGYEHCGQCADMPCDMLKDLFGDPEHGDGGARLRNLQNWNNENYIYEKLGNIAQEEAKKL